MLLLQEKAPNLVQYKAPHLFVQNIFRQHHICASETASEALITIRRSNLSQRQRSLRCRQKRHHVRHRVLLQRHRTPINFHGCGTAQNVQQNLHPLPGRHHPQDASLHPHKGPPARTTSAPGTSRSWTIIGSSAVKHCCNSSITESATVGMRSAKCTMLLMPFEYRISFRVFSIAQRTKI